MIIVKLKGGMGNQMFQYALGRALSIKNNTALGFDLSFLLDRTPRKHFTLRNYDLDLFNISSEIVPQSKIPTNYRKPKSKIGLCFKILKTKFYKIKGIEKSFNFDSSILSMGDDSYLDGYWQSPKYFEGIEEIIRKDFTLKNPLPFNIQNLIEVVKQENSLCVHVRRGDYVGNSHHEVVNKQYYDKALEKVKSLTNIDKIYVFSDDIKWCEDNIKFEYPTMFVGEEYAGTKAEGHMALMSACHNFIIPNSSFAWWSAWLATYKNKIVIIPKKWFPDGSILGDDEDIVPESWIKIQF